MNALPLATSTEITAAFQLGPLAILVLLYARRAHTLTKTDRPVPRWRQACFYGAFLLIAAALTALGHASHKLLWMHMIEHLLIGDVAALLIVLGLTGWLLEPILQIKLFARLKALSHPVPAFLLWASDWYVWHLPVFYEAALRHAGVEVIEHAMFLGFGINMWMCLFGPLPTASQFGNSAKLIYILAVRLTGAVLGNIFLWSGTIFYPYYLSGEAHFRISPLADQNIAGAIMLGEATLTTLCLFYWLFTRASRESEEQQHLLHVAHTRGLELTHTGAPEHR